VAFHSCNIFFLTLLTIVYQLCVNTFPKSEASFLTVKTIKSTIRQVALKKAKRLRVNFYMFCWPTFLVESVDNHNIFVYGQVGKCYRHYLHKVRIDVVTATDVTSWVQSHSSVLPKLIAKRKQWNQIQVNLKHVTVISWSALAENSFSCFLRDRLTLTYLLSSACWISTRKKGGEWERWGYRTKQQLCNLFMVVICTA